MKMPQTNQSSPALIDVSTYLQKKREQIEQKLAALVPAQEVAHSRLFRAARYALLGSGKRLRPLLTLATAEMLGAKSSAAMAAACAIEMIHTYSLIHDDLPCMDDDDFRRGKPSLHKTFGEGHAVLTGDYLLTYAFEVIADDPLLRDDQKVALTLLLAKNAGDKGMIAGQILDIEAEGVAIDIDDLHNIHHHKTGAMITASVVFGGLIADASQAQIQHLRAFGDVIGLAYQIVDDVIDVEACQQKHGKAISSDEINHKTTYVTLLGPEPAREKAYALLERALAHLGKIDCDTALLQELAKRLVHRQI